MPIRNRIQRLFSWKSAIAEILILIVGILAALAVDRWAEERRDAVTAGEYITRLKNDVEVDLQAYSETVVWSRSIDNSAVFVLDVYRGRDLNSEEFDLMMLHIFRASWGSKGRTTTTTYDDLVSTGNIALLPVGVRNAITEYYGIKSSYERRIAEFEATARQGYWRVPERVLGPDLTRSVWLGIQGRTPDFSPNPGDLGLDEATVSSVVERLRSIENLELLLAEIRHQMVQREVLFGERLPKAANELAAALQKAL